MVAGICIPVLFETAAADQQAAQAQKAPATQSQAAASSSMRPGKPLPLGTVVACLPKNCTPTPVGGVEYYYCSGNSHFRQQGARIRSLLYIHCFLRIRKPFGIVAVFLALLFLSVPAQSAEIEPRSYANTPVGINFLVAGYAYTSGGLSTPGASPIRDAKLKMNSGVLAYARTLDVWGKSGKVDVILPYSRLTGSAMFEGRKRQREVTGFHDPLFRFSVNFYGAPAMSLKEFVDYRQDLIIGASVQVSAPLGQYSEKRLVNLGNNRWFVKPDIGISKAWGPLTLELSTGVLFFSKNDDYLGGKTLEQDPVSSSQIHLEYNFGRSIWAAVSWTYDYGGRTTVEGVKSGEREENSRAGITLALPVNRNNSVKIFGSTSLHTSQGTNFSLVGAAWQYRWGGGL